MGADARHPHRGTATVHAAEGRLIYEPREQGLTGQINSVRQINVALPAPAWWSKKNIQRIGYLNRHLCTYSPFVSILLFFYLLEITALAKKPDNPLRHAERGLNATPAGFTLTR